jgi:hypothetical protein
MISGCNGVLLSSDMRRVVQLIILLCLTMQVCASTHTLVLVVRADSRVADLDSLTVRKLFLGLPVLVDGSPLHPVRNRTDSQLDPIFLQQIVAMSQSAYDRQILMGVNRQGWLRPTEVTDANRLLLMLYGDPNAVSFMWLNDVEHNPKLRVIRVLWSE